MKEKHRVHLLPDDLCAAEYKWIISKCIAFIGARTHATIAAFSTGVPTVSLAYSIKALGLNKLLFDTDNYCLQPEHLTPEAVVEKVQLVLDKSVEIRRQLMDQKGKIIADAFKAGEAMRRILNV